VNLETIMVPAGRKFAVRLKSRFITNYLWQLCTPAEGIQLLGTRNEKPMNSARQGEKAVQVFRLRAPAAGEYTIRFTLKGPSDKAIQTHTVKIIAS